MPETVTEEKKDEGATAEAPKECRNIVLTGFGGLKMLKVQKKAEPKPGEGEVLIRVKACGVNFVDLMVRQGVLEHPPKTPLTIGFECAGEVEDVDDKNTEGIAVGDRVIGFTEYNAWGELVVVNAKYVYKMPSNMSYQDGAALPMNFMSAYIMLFDIGNLKKGMSVFAHNIGGGVGVALSQLCKTVEDVTIYGTASCHKHEAVKENVSSVFDRLADYCQEVRKLSPEGVDIVLDCMCGEDTNKGISLLKPMGKYVLYGSSNIVTGETKSFFSFAKSWWQVDKVSPIKLFDENKTISGFQLRNLAFQQGQDQYVRTVMNKLFQLYSQGKIQPVIDSVWAFEDINVLTYMKNKETDAQTYVHFYMPIHRTGRIIIFHPWRMGGLLGRHGPVPDAMQKMHDRKNIGKLILDPTQEPKPKVQSAPSVEGATPPEDSKENKEAVVNGDQQ